MTLDYDDLDQAMKAHSLLRQHRLRVTFFPNRQSSVISQGGAVPTPKLTHRIVVNTADADQANELLRADGLAPPL